MIYCAGCKGPITDLPDTWIQFGDGKKRGDPNWHQTLVHDWCRTRTGYQAVDLLDPDFRKEFERRFKDGAAKALAEIDQLSQPLTLERITAEQKDNALLREEIGRLWARISELEGTKEAPTPQPTPSYWSRPPDLWGTI